jgi:hypothetical protein
MNIDTVDEKDERTHATAGEPKSYYVYNNVIFITEHVNIDQSEPIEIIQCAVDMENNLNEKIISLW